MIAGADEYEPQHEDAASTEPESFGEQAIKEGKAATVIDDILASPEPYYYRAGSGQVMPAVEQAILNMRAGDVWEMVVPPKLGFGEKGRPSSPGKPRISGDAILDFTLELVAVPGKDEEILDANGIID